MISHVSTTGLSSNNFQGNVIRWLVIPLFCLSLGLTISLTDIYAFDDCMHLFSDKLRDFELFVCSQIGTQANLVHSSGTQGGLPQNYW